jgi:hypothetical protein
MLTKIKSALVSLVIAGVLAGAIYILGIGNIFALDLKGLINVVAIAVLVGLVSLLKSWGTTPTGTFAGVQVK